MQRVGVIFIVFYILVSTLSLSLQGLYKVYFCMDTKEYLSVAGKNITICGKICDFEFKKTNDNTNGSGNFTFNLNAPALYFQTLSVPAFLSSPVMQLRTFLEDHYEFQYSDTSWQPPRFS